MADIPPSIGDRFWPATRFLGYRPPHIHEKEQAEDAEARGRMLPRVIHEHNTYSRQSRGLARFRENEHVQTVGNWALTFLGSFFGIALVCTMSRSSPFLRRSAPIVAGSMGAEAVLLYAAWQTPLAQPPNVIIGNVVSAVIGVALAKGFNNLPGFVVGQVGDANWAAASLAISLSLLVMQILRVVHPPGGATALLAVTIPSVYSLSWFYVGLIAASSCIMLAWAMFTNNIGHRRYPNYWTTQAIADKVQARSGKKQAET